MKSTRSFADLFVGFLVGLVSGFLISAVFALQVAVTVLVVLIALHLIGAITLTGGLILGSFGVIIGVGTVIGALVGTLVASD